MLDNLRSDKSWEIVDAAVIPSVGSFRYIEPQLTVLHGDPAVSRFVVISSAGAVGKSALATHLAATRNAIVWDLSKVKLGSNSFLGTLARTFGAEQLTSALAGIAQGEMLLVFDALDEAEIHSGREGVDIFVKDVIVHSGGGGKPSIVFLGRPDSAKRVFQALLASGCDVSHVDLGYFSREAAVDFCYETFLKKKEDAPVHGRVFRRKLEGIFSSGISGSNSASPGWCKDSAEFYGYAPVLQAIATVLAGEPNLHSFQVDGGWSRGRFICDVMESISNRERDKFRSNAAALPLVLPLVGDVYSTDDQILRLLKYSVGDPSWSVVEADDASDAKELGKAVESFLPQHPFVSELREDVRGRFSGPAFRDYCLAYALCSENDDLRLFAEVFLIDNPVVSSAVLFDVYLEKGGGKVEADHVDAVYFSFAAGVGKSACDLEIYDHVDVSLLILGNGESDFEFEIRGKGAIAVSGALCNAQVETSRKLAFEAPDVFEIGNSDLSVGTISFKCSGIATEGDVSLAATIIELPSAGAIAIKPRASSTLTVTFPGSERHPWTPYHAPEVAEKDGSEAEKLGHTIGRILRWFRKDRRADFARYRDLIRKHIVGRGGNAQQAFEFLEEIGAVEEQGNLYVLKANVLEFYGIRWAGGSKELDPRLIDRINLFLKA